MARSAEKAMTALARFRRMKMEENQTIEKRPYIAAECHDMKKAFKWRGEIIGEISKKVSQIQNAGLMEHQIRDLNDSINKSLREKRHWEHRIIELGGPNLIRYGPKMLDHEGREVPGNRGYKYFGAARDLPGVRELFEREAPSKKRKTRAQLMRNLDADYYGYRDEDDGVLIPLEKEMEAKLMAEAVGEWKSVQALNAPTTSNSKEEDIYAKDNDDLIPKEYEEDDSDKHSYVSHVPVPSQKDVQDALLLRKKRELLEQYASETLQTQSAEARTLMGL